MYTCTAGQLNMKKREWMNECFEFESSVLSRKCITFFGGEIIDMQNKVLSFLFNIAGYCPSCNNCLMLLMFLNHRRERLKTFI